MKTLLILILTIILAGCEDMDGTVIDPNPRGAKIHFINRTSNWVGLYISHGDGYVFLDPYDSTAPKVYTRYATARDGTNLIGEKWVACVALYQVYPSDVFIDSGYIVKSDTMEINQ
jgi:hypothetical protein